MPVMRGYLSLVQISSLLCLTWASAVQAAEPAVTVYAAGDIADCRKQAGDKNGAAATAAVILPLLQRDPQARVLTLGDNTYPVGAASEFQDCFEASWGKFKQKILPSPGNHDYYTPQASGYFAYFGDQAGPGQRGYYRVKLGNWQLYSLNSYLQPAAHKEQLAWLKKELAEHTAPCTLAFWHHPLYSSGGHGNSPRMQEVWDILYAANADLVLAGHDHDYERFAPQDGAGNADPARGMAEFVVGSGGAALSPFGVRRANSVRAQNNEHGVLKLVLRENGYDWQFLPAAGGSFSDSGSAQCH